MKREIAVFLAVCTLSAVFTACGKTGGESSVNSGVSESSDIGNNGNKTAFSEEEEGRFQSAFGFVIPFIPNGSYRVKEYEGYNGDLMAYENGLAFYAEGLTQEACEQYVKNLKEDENYSFEYPQDGYFYFSRNGYFVKVCHYWMKTGFGLDVYVYSYTFEENENSEESTEEENSSSEEQEEPIRTGLQYEQHKDGTYSVIGFYGDEDGVVEIPDTYNGFPVRYIRGNAFYGQECITEVIVGDNVYSIEGNAFMHCCNLEKVTLGNSLELIDMQAFLGCEKLEEITIPASVTFIGNSVFRDCTRLKSIVLEDPNGWCTTSNLHKPFPVEDMSNPSTVAKYFTDTHAGKGWRKD